MTTSPTFDDYLALSPAGRLLLATRGALAGRGIGPDRVFLRVRDRQEAGERFVSVTVLSADAVTPVPLELLVDLSRKTGCLCTCECGPCRTCDHSSCAKADQCLYISDECDDDSDDENHPDVSVSGDVKRQRQAAEPHILEYDGTRWTYTDMALFQAPVRSTCDPWHDYGPDLTAEHAGELAAFLAERVAASAARAPDPDPEGNQPDGF